MKLHLVRLFNCPILEQLQLEEALLRADQRNWCLINEGSPPAIVMGISGKPEALLNQPLVKKHSVPVIRRFSGGGTVFVDQNTLFVSLICNSTCSDVPCSPDKIHCWAKTIYSRLFEGKNFDLRENDYVLGDRKFGGNAQYLTKNRFLHHSSLLWDFDEHKMEYLLMPPKRPEYRGERHHGQFLCRLKEHLPCKEDFILSLLNSMRSTFEICEIPHSDILPSLSVSHRKSTVVVSL